MAERELPDKALREQAGTVLEGIGQVNFFNRSELLRRGWTQRRIQVFLGRHDREYTRPADYYRTVEKLWDARRVLRAEQEGALICSLPKRSCKPLSSLEGEEPDEMR